MRDIRPTLILHPLTNSDGKKDATGAFIPKAHEFAKLWQIPGHAVHPFDNKEPLGARLEHVLKLLDGHAGLRNVVCFCHGWKDGLQFGVTTKNLTRFVDALVRAANHDGIKVVLYACDAGRDADSDREDDKEPGPGGSGGFADLLRDELRKRGLKASVIAHATRGHTTNNPYVRVFTTADPEDGGSWLIEPKSAPWAVWRRQLAESNLWAKFPWMAREELLEALRSARSKQAATAK